MKRHEILGIIEKTEHEQYCGLSMAYNPYYTFDFVEDKYNALNNVLKSIGEGKRIKITVEEI